MAAIAEIASILGRNNVKNLTESKCIQYFFKINRYC